MQEILRCGEEGQRLERVKCLNLRKPISIDSFTLFGTVDLLIVSSNGFGEDRWDFFSDVLQLIYGGQMTTNLLQAVPIE